MSFFQRAATIAAMTLGIAGFVGVSTPGFAFELDRTVNVPTVLPVPLSIEIPALVPALADSVKTDAEQPTVVPAVDDVSHDAGPDYASLAAAVADQDAPATMDRDLACMAGAIYYEAKGEPLSGQLAVAEVIINRSKSGRFPKSLCSVITQAGQFSFVRRGVIPTPANNKAYRTAIAVAQVAMGDNWNSPASNALYFHARRVSPGWRMTKVASIGNHIFYR